MSYPQDLEAELMEFEKDVTQMMGRWRRIKVAMGAKAPHSNVWMLLNFARLEVRQFLLPSSEDPNFERRIGDEYGLI